MWGQASYLSVRYVSYYEGIGQPTVKMFRQFWMGMVYSILEEEYSKRPMGKWIGG